MAELLTEFDFRKSSHDGYPWDDWLNGQIWKLKKGEDFHAKSRSMVCNARVRAKKSGKQLRTATFDDYLVIQAVDNPKLRTRKKEE